MWGRGRKVVLPVFNLADEVKKIKKITSPKWGEGEDGSVSYRGRGRSREGG